MPTGRERPVHPHNADLEAAFQEQMEEEADHERLDEIVMAIEMKDRGTIGCCYYVAAREAMFLMSDAKSAGLDIVDQRRCLEELTAACLIMLISEASH